MWVFAVLLDTISKNLVTQTHVRNEMKKVPLCFFRDAWTGIFALRETWMRIYFFCDSWIYIFPSSGNWFSIFSWPVKYMHLLSRDLWTNDFFGNIFFTFFEILVSLKLVNYTKVDVEPAHSMRLWMENWSRTNHSDSELVGPRICNHGQESWDKFALSAFVAHIRCEYNLNCLTSPPNFCWFSTLYWRGGEK